MLQLDSSIFNLTSGVHSPLEKCTTSGCVCLAMILLTRRRNRSLRPGWVGCHGRRSKGFDVAHNLPAFWFGQLGPNGHAVANNSICHHPENCAWGGGLYSVSHHARAAPCAIRDRKRVV